MAAEEPESRVRIEAEDIAFCALVYVLGLILLSFVSLMALVMWSFFGLFIAFGIARFAAHGRATKRISDENARWIAQHRDAIEELHRTFPERNEPL
jgi:hypothetical protein